MSEDFRKFYDDLILLVGEVPTQALVEKQADVEALPPDGIPGLFGEVCRAERRGASA